MDCYSIIEQMGGLDAYDATALEALELINQALKSSGKTLNISEAKGPVLDKLYKTNFIEHLKPGKIFFHTEDAAKKLG